MSTDHREQLRQEQERRFGKMVDLCFRAHPYYRELFNLLNAAGYDRYTMIEAQPLKSANPEDTIRFMKFYKALWEQLSRPQVANEPGDAA